ncbi:sugar transferase [Microlunatus lacustris]
MVEFSASRGRIRDSDQIFTSGPAVTAPLQGPRAEPAEAAQEPDGDPTVGWDSLLDLGRGPLRWTARPPRPLTRSSGRGGFLRWSTRYVAWLAWLDAITAALAVLVASTLPLVPPFDAWKLVTLAGGAAVAWPLTIAVCRGYERTNIGVGGDEMRSVLRTVVLAIAAGAVPSALTGNDGVVAMAVLAAPLAGSFGLVVRFGARKALHARQRRGRDLRRVIVTGDFHTVGDLVHLLQREPHNGMSVIGVCVPRSQAERAKSVGLVVIGDLDAVPAATELYEADAVAVAGGGATRDNYLRELSWGLEGAGVELLVHPGLVEVAGPRLHIRPHVGLPLLQVEQPCFTGWRRFAKRMTDLLLAGFGVLFLSPLLAAIALAVKLTDAGPVIFRQVRVGLDGSTFTMLKFRSMHVDAEQRLAELRAQNPGTGLMFKLQDDPRITDVGRFLRRYSLDELPQLFNVLAGSMSLVGPRPPLQSEVDAYEDHARRRLLVTPGLTGLWQVSGRSLLSWEETVRLDLRYVENWTLTLDLLIIWKTFFAVLTKRGAF